MPDRLNHVAVFVAAIAFFLWGGLWYDVLFGRLWMASLGPAAASLPKPSPALFIGSFVLGWILSYGTAIALTRRPEDQTAAQGVSFAIFMGIVVWGTLSLQQTLYEGRPFLYWAINAGYAIIGFAIVGAIVGGWRKGSPSAVTTGP